MNQVDPNIPQEYAADADETEKIGKERSVPPDRIYTMGANTVEDRIRKGELDDISGNYPILASMPLLRINQDTASHNIYRSIGIENFTRQLWYAQRRGIRLNSGRYSDISLRGNDPRLIPWIQKSYSRMFYTHPVYGHGPFEADIPLTAVPYILEDFRDYQQFNNEFFPGCNLPLAGLRVLEVPGKGVCKISGEQILLTHGTLRDALQKSSGIFPNEHWGYFEKILKLCLDYITSLLTKRTSVHDFVSRNLLGTYTDPNPSNLAIIPDNVKGKLSFLIKNVDFWPPSLLAIASKKPKTFRVSTDEEYVYSPRNSREVELRYFNRYGVAANVVRGLRRVLERDESDTENDVNFKKETWETRVLPTILDHSGIMSVIEQGFIPHHPTKEKLARVTRILARSALYDINDVEEVKSYFR